jgi:hypothetical protein
VFTVGCPIKLGELTVCPANRVIRSFFRGETRA